jgi:peptide chain release factor 1
MDDVEIIAQRGHGKGGQHQNKVSSAIRALHKPTGIRVFINGRDQYQNKRLALQILAARVAEAKRQIIAHEHNRAKVEQLGFGTRSGKVRTYNFINGFVIDHRTGQKTHRITEVMKGKFELLR